MDSFDCFSEQTTVDFEYFAPDGRNPEVICMAAHELKSGKKHLCWSNQLYEMEDCPFPSGEDSLVICYSAPAELSSFYSLGWREPVWILDLYPEQRVLENGRLYKKHKDHKPFSMVETLKHYGLAHIEASEKQSNQDLAQRGWPFSPAEKKLLMDYVDSDVDALDRLLPVMLPLIENFREALFRGAFQKAVARSERHGIPLDPNWKILKGKWPGILKTLIESTDAEYGCYEENPEGKMVFKEELFDAYVERLDADWPTTATGKYKTDKDTFSEMSKDFPEVEALHELRKTIKETSSIKLAIGRDNRNRTGLLPYAAKTGRCTPSGNKFVWGCPKFMRYLIKPEPGYSLSSLDYQSQEMYVAAALSEDPAMMEIAQSTDPYITMAQWAKMAPEEASKYTHPEVRKQFKALTLGTNYGMGVQKLSEKLGCSLYHARRLQEFHKRKFSTYWEWVRREESHGLLYNRLESNFGWKVHLVDSISWDDDGEAYSYKEPNLQAIQNWPVQCHSFHILMVAMMQVWESGIAVCSPVHDSLCIHSPTDRIEQDIKLASKLMTDAAEFVVGVPIPVDANTCHYPDRFKDESPAAEAMWKKITALVPELQD